LASRAVVNAAWFSGFNGEISEKMIFSLRFGQIVWWIKTDNTAASHSVNIVKRTKQTIKMNGDEQ